MSKILELSDQQKRFIHARATSRMREKAEKANRGFLGRLKSAVSADPAEMINRDNFVIKCEGCNARLELERGWQCGSCGARVRDAAAYERCNNSGCSHPEVSAYECVHCHTINVYSVFKFDQQNSKVTGIGVAKVSGGVRDMIGVLGTALLATELGDKLQQQVHDLEQRRKDRAEGNSDDDDPFKGI